MPSSDDDDPGYGAMTRLLYKAPRHIERRAGADGARRVSQQCGADVPGRAGRARCGPA